MSLQVTLAILAATNAIGTLCTIFVPDAKRMTLKDGALRAQSLFERLIGGQVLIPCTSTPIPCSTCTDVPHDAPADRVALRSASAMLGRQVYAESQQHLADPSRVRGHQFVVGTRDR